MNLLQLAILSYVIYLIIVFVNRWLYKRMLDDLRVRNPAIRAFNSSLNSSDNSALYRKIFREDKPKMRLLRTVQILGWLAILLAWTAWISKQSFSFEKHENNRSNKALQAIGDKSPQPER